MIVKQIVLALDIGARLLPALGDAGRAQLDRNIAQTPLAFGAASVSAAAR